MIDSLPDEKLSKLHEDLNAWIHGRGRDYFRRPVSAEVDLIIEGRDRVFQTFIKNISAGGVFIDIKGEFKPGSTAKLVFSLPDTERPFKLNGHIVRAEEDGIAIQFDQLSPYFKSFLAEQLSKPHR